MEAGAAVCPWPFLNQVSSPVKEVPKATSPTTKPKSFAQVLSKSFSFPLCQLPKPCIKGEAISIRISEDEYQQGLLSCKNNLHGRLILPKGSTPIKVNDLKEKLSKLWNPVAQWKLIPLGKGFFEISFASVDDLRNIWMVGTWNLQPGLLRLSQWSADFNPSKMRQTHAQCWIRLYNLPMEYWRPKTLCEIAAGVGTPIALDEATKNKQFGHFARVLVDIDLAKMLPAEILVERESFAFFVSLEYEKLPLFCSFCGSIGHSLEQCRKKDPQPMNKPKIDKPFQNSTEHARQKSAHTETEVVQDTHATIPLNPMDHLDKVQEINKNSDNTPSDEVQNTIIESQEDVNPTPAQVENQIAIIPPEISNVDISVQKPCGVVSADFQEGHLEIFLNGIENQESTQSVCEKDVADVLQVQHQTPLEIDHVSPTQDADGWNGSMNPRVLHDMRILSKFWGDVVDETDEDIPPYRPSQELNQDVNFTMVLPKSQKHRLKKGAKQGSKHKEVRTSSRH